ncbi:MAG TPA: hypothetical protein VEW03_04420 [Longimicrobiaceae bacterium]|nr:hypothetical protein [Longimicrobiaceae bacterium]
MPNRSQAFGLVILSNVPIPGLEHAAVSVVSEPPLRVQLEAGRTLVSRSAVAAARVLRVSRERDDQGTPAGVVRDLVRERLYHFQYSDGTEFLVDRGGTSVRGTWRGDATLEDTATYLLGPILAFVLRLRGLLAVHASAIEMEGTAVLIVGPSGAGKSTTAAGFAMHGWPVLTDDLAVIAPRGDHVDVVPTYPRVRLWDDSVHGLWGGRRVLPLLTPTWEKRYLPLSAERAEFTQRPLPLRAIFLLREREASERAPRIEEMSPLAAFPLIMGNLLANQAIPDESAEVDFRFSSLLVERVPAFSLVAHSDPLRLGDLCRLVAARVAGLPRDPAAAAPLSHV